MNKNILKYFGLAALLALGANAESATYAVTTQTQLDEANAKATRGDTIEISSPCVDGEYVLNSVGVGYAIRATVPGVCLKRINYSTDHDDYIGGPVSLSNLTWRVAKGYYPHFKGVSAVDCTFKGFFDAEDGCTFDNCTFYAPGTIESGIDAVDYYMWCYSGDVTFRSCHFYGAGKHLHCYNEGNNPTDATTGKKIPWTVTLEGCDFHSTKKDKPAVNVKELCGNKQLYYNVIISNCTTDENFPAAGTFDAAASKYVISPLVQVDIRNQTSASEGISITLDGKNVYKDGVVPQSAAVAKIGTKEYETVSDALKDAAAAAGETEVKLLCDSSESSTVPAIKLNGDIKVTAESATTVVIAPTANSAAAFDTDGMAYVESADAEAVRKLTVGENVTFRLPESATYKGAAYLGYNTPAELDVYGNLDLYLLYVAPSSLVTIRPSGSVKVGSEDIIIRRYANVLVDGTDADWSAEKPQAKFGYVDIQGGALVLSNTFVNAGAWINMYNRNNLTDDKPTLALFGTQLDSGSNLTLKDAACEVWLDAASCITTKGVANSGSINIDATGAAEPVKVIDYTGTDAMTLADYGTVNVTSGEAYVEDNDLWVKAKVEVVPEKPTAEEVKEATKVVDESGEEVSPTEQQAEAAKTEVEKVAQSFDNPEIAKVETHVAAAAMTVQGEGEEQKVVVKSAIVEELQKAAPAGTIDQITSESDVTSYVKVALGEAKVAVKDDGAALKSVTFDVKPMAETTVAVGAEKTVVVAQIPNGEIKEPITFRLPLTDAFTVSAIVTHEGDPDRLCMVLGEAGARYVEMSATHFSFFTVTPSEIVETTTESKTVLGIKRVDYTVTQSTADLAAAVPWLQAANADMPVSQLITTGLSNGDMIQVYDLEQKTYYSWRYNGTAWEAVTLSTGAAVPSADTYVLKRGRAFWYKPVGGMGSSGTYTQVGLYSESTITSKVDSATVASASFANPVHFLMASPKYEDFNLKEKLTAAAGCVDDDVVVIVATGKRYRFNGTVWGQDIDKEVTKFGVTVTQKVFEATEGAISVPAGTAFWYLSAGGAPEFEW